jgi:hypothetical protein
MRKEVNELIYEIWGFCDSQDGVKWVGSNAVLTSRYEACSVSEVSSL